MLSEVLHRPIRSANVLFGFGENLSRSRKKFQGWLGQTTLPLLTSLLPAPAEDPSTDLTARGGIPGDRKSVAVARELALSTVAEQLTNQKPLRDWDSSTMYAVVQRLRELGAEPIFYEMPLGRTTASLYETPVRVEDRAYFQGVIKRWGVP